MTPYGVTRTHWVNNGLACFLDRSFCQIILMKGCHLIHVFQCLKFQQHKRTLRNKSEVTWNALFPQCDVDDTFLGDSDDVITYHPDGSIVLERIGTGTRPADDLDMESLTTATSASFDEIIRTITFESGTDSELSLTKSGKVRLKEQYVRIRLLSLPPLSGSAKEKWFPLEIQIVLKLFLLCYELVQKGRNKDLLFLLPSSSSENTIIFNSLDRITYNQSVNWVIIDLGNNRRLKGAKLLSELLLLVYFQLAGVVSSRRHRIRHQSHWGLPRQAPTHWDEALAAWRRGASSFQPQAATPGVRPNPAYHPFQTGPQSPPTAHITLAGTRGNPAGYAD